MTLLRIVRRLPLPAAGSPFVLGVDDFALRRGHHYGTVLVDLQAHRIVDLLPERTSEVVSGWLADREPPEIICRDRGGAYAEAAQHAAPAATQCADRFHLSSNATAVLERVLARHPAAVRTATMAEAATEAPGADALLSAPPDEKAAPDPAQATPPAARAEDGSDARQQRRRARYEEVVALHRAGWSLTAIGAHLGLCRPTVRKYVAADAYPGIAPRCTLLRSGSTHAAYLRERWDAGCRDATVLYQELRARGFPGSLRMVQRAVAAWRPHPGPHGRGAARPACPQVGAATARALSPRQATWLLLRSPEGLRAEEQTLRTRLLATTPAIQAAVTAVEAFRTLVRTHDRAALDLWLEAATHSDVPEIRAFAASIRRDYAAIAAGLALPWSSGQVEGQVTKIKLRRRQMYGRGKLDLLRRRVILAS
jgi:transposase